jgi:hypothetical protein
MSGDLREKSYRGGLRLAAVFTVGVCLLASACQSGSSGTRADTSDAKTATIAKQQPWCEAPLNAAWKRVLRKRPVSHPSHESVGALALANDDRSFFGETHSGIVEVDAAKGRYTEIKPLAGSGNIPVIIGSFDGRWLVWTEYHSRSENFDPSNFTVWSWDSHTDRLRRIGAAARSPSGQFWASAWQGAVALDGYATWEQGSGPDSRGEIHVVDLKSGRNRIVRRGHPVGSFLVRGRSGALVIWPESMKRGVLTVMKAADAKTGRPVATPTALKNVRGGLVPVTGGGGAIAFTTDNWKSLWWSPSLDVAPRRVFTTRNGDPIDFGVTLTGRYLSFTVWPKAYLADAPSGRYIEIKPGASTYLGKKSFALGKPPKTKASPITDLVFLPLKSLPPIPPCK